MNLIDAIYALMDERERERERHMESKEKMKE
jgi:hypothetical protein